MLRTVFKSGKS